MDEKIPSTNFCSFSVLLFCGFYFFLSSLWALNNSHFLKNNLMFSKVNPFGSSTNSPLWCFLLGERLFSFLQQTHIFWSFVGNSTLSKLCGQPYEAVVDLPLLSLHGFCWFEARFMLLYWCGTLASLKIIPCLRFYIVFLHILYAKSPILPHVIFDFSIPSFAFKFFYLF